MTPQDRRIGQIWFISSNASIEQYNRFFNVLGDDEKWEIEWEKLLKELDNEHQPSRNPS